LEERVRDRSLSVRLHQRYRIIADGAEGHGTAAIADRLRCSMSTVTLWLKRFNASGFTTFERATNPKGREPILRAAHLRALIDVALSSPTERGLPFAVWSVASQTARVLRSGRADARRHG
jgi:transposase